MVKMNVVYQGELHCEATHGPSQSKIETDAPTDNKGRGERFSPTDLVGTALATCILTTMAIVAERDGFNFAGASIEVEKHMADKPRRIDALPLKITLSATLTADQRRKLEETAKHCPVHRSLHPDLKMTMTFIYV